MAHYTDNKMEFVKIITYPKHKEWLLNIWLQWEVLKQEQTCLRPEESSEMYDTSLWKSDKPKSERFLLKRADQVNILIFVGALVSLFYYLLLQIHCLFACLKDQDLNVTKSMRKKRKKKVCITEKTFLRENKIENSTNNFSNTYLLSLRLLGTWSLW